MRTVSEEARKVAIYCSVLPLHRKIIEELIREKSLGEELDAFAEFYFGGLLKKKTNIKDEFLFYDGVRRELLAYISMKEIKSVYGLLNAVISESLGLNYTVLELLYETDDISETLSDKEKELMEILIEVLEEKGDFYDIQNRGKMNEKIDTVYLKSNTYQMGSKNEHDDEKSIQQITFDYNFEIAKHPVTFEEYDLYCEAKGIEKPSARGWGRGKRPVINVSWDDANDYCEWLSKETGKNYRLPTEAEWEYACRAGTTTKWSFGDDEKELDKYAWYDKNSYRKTHRVEQKLPNPWGLYDMHGNVWEWCKNNYKKIVKDTKGFHRRKNRRSKVLRGGAWNNTGNSTYFSVRSRLNPTIRDYDNGFRLVRTLP